MHKATFLEGTLWLTIQPNGPILIKSGSSGGANPALPDMEFVRTQGQVYIPGASLKGVLRAHCERICRTMDSAEQQQEKLSKRQELDHADREAVQRYERERRTDISEQDLEKALPSPDQRVPLADNPLGGEGTYGAVGDMDYNSGRAMEHMKLKNDKYRHTPIIYRRSSFTSQMFGHTSMAARVHFADAYPEGEVQLEERNGVAIDRIYGSVAVGPFNYETAVAGTFATRIAFANITLAQLGLLGLALRDLAEGRVAIGFGKSRGLGRVKIAFQKLAFYYPACELDDSNQVLRPLGRSDIAVGETNQLLGIGALCADAAYASYNFPSADNDKASLPDGLAYKPDELFGVRLTAEGNEQVRAIWKACIGAWKSELGL